MTPLPRGAAAAALFLATFLLAGVAAASASSLSGVAYKDLNRDAVQQTNEPVLSGHQIYLFDSGGHYVDSRTTDASGRYQFVGLTDGTYRLEYARSPWVAMRNDWVPTTTGSIRPVRSLQLSGNATADFGWRPIVRSTDIDAPISSYTGSNGLRIESFDDVVGAREIFDALMRGTVGSEASRVVVRFDYGTNNASTPLGASTDSSGRYTDYNATSYVTYGAWLDDGPRQLAHEYGHAWSMYHAYIAQQDPTLTAYLKARGLYGDPRVNSSYSWDAGEMIAEDYRQLLGPAEGQAAGQMNGEIPPAKDVPGLKDFLLNTFTQPPPSSSPPPPSEQALAVSSLAMNPSPVVKSGTASFTLSAPASVTVRILAADGSVVRTLLSGASRAAGGVSVAWDRKDASGRRAKPGAYSVSVSAAGGGQSASATKAFNVS